MEKILLVDENPNGTKEKDPESMQMVKYFQEMEEFRKAKKPIYIEILTGKRKGCIARFIPDDKIIGRSYFERKNWANDFDTWNYEMRASGHFVWDGRKNKVMASIWPSWKSSPEYAWLKDYDGPTIYEMFDVKKAKEKVLKNPVVTDIDGTQLRIGDAVLYVNIRYGSGSDLCRGVIDRFEVDVWPNEKHRKAGHRIYTIVKEQNTGEESKIEFAQRLILRNPSLVPPIK